MKAIETTELIKQYKDKTAVDHLSFSVEEGELFALLGVNGAGKTTAVKLLTTLSQPTAGDARLLGYSIKTEADRVKAIIGVSPQETAVAPNLTVEENLRLIAGVHGFSKENTIAKAEELISRFSLEEFRKKRAGKLSGGWQRRLSIAMAMISEPRILFLDEPTLGLDVLARAELWAFIRSLRGKMTIVLTTHYMEEAEMLSDRIGIMANGRMLGIATAEEWKAKTGKTRFEDAFIAAVGGA